MDKDIWIVTHGGHKFHITDPWNSTITIEDIAAALSKLCRFNGHTRKFYSVAQHSVLVSRLTAARNSLHGLLHDAAEAYCGDVTRPMKKLIKGYKDIEANVHAAIYHALDIQYPTLDEHYDVNVADNVALFTEKRDLLNAAHVVSPDQDLYPTAAQRITPLSPAIAEKMFLATYYALKHQPMVTYHDK